MSAFWQTWMKLWCLSACLVGIILAGAGFEATGSLARLYFVSLNGPIEFNLDENVRFSIVVLGAVMIGWGLTFWTAIYAANQLKPEAAKPIWIMLTGSLFCWFLIDSSLSIHTGYWRNVIPNVIFVTTFSLPVLRSGVLTK